MKRTLGYLVESAYNHPEVVLIVVFFVAAFGLLIGSEITELIGLRREQRRAMIRAQLHEVLKAESAPNPLTTDDAVAVLAGSRRELVGDQNADE